MSDDTRVLFEKSLEAIPVPSGSPVDASRRGRTYVRRRRLVQVLSIALLLAGAIVVGEGVVGEGTSAPPVNQPEDVGLVDEIALGVVDDLGPFCRGYDFYYKAAFGPALYRPVQCGMDMALIPRTDPLSETAPTPGPSPSLSDDDFRTRLLRGPRLLVHAFSTNAAKEAWVDAHEPFRGGRFEGDAWVVDVIYRANFAGVRDELSAESVTARPRRVWRIGERFVEDAPRGLLVEVPLRRASRHIVEGTAEILAAQLGSYSEGGDLFPAWVVTVRRCVPQYGGIHASPYCAGDRHHVVIDAVSGRRIASFSS